MPEKEPLDMTEEELDADISIDNSSPFKLEQEVLDHSRKEAKYYRAWAIANKELENKMLELDVLIAELVDEIRIKAMEIGKPIPPSALSEIRRSIVPKSKRYKAKKEEVIEANEKANILSGLAKAWVGRGYRFSDLIELSKPVLRDGPMVYQSGQKGMKKAEEILDKYEKNDD